MAHGAQATKLDQSQNVQAMHHNRSLELFHGHIQQLNDQIRYKRMYFIKP